MQISRHLELAFAGENRSNYTRGGLSLRYSGKVDTYLFSLKALQPGTELPSTSFKSKITGVDCNRRVLYEHQTALLAGPLKRERKRARGGGGLNTRTRLGTYNAAAMERFLGFGVLSASAAHLHAPNWAQKPMH